MNVLDLQGIEQRLDKIITLLELRNSIEVARDQMTGVAGGIYPSSCNCAEHKRGEGTGGWTCPVHGQQF